MSRPLRIKYEGAMYQVMNRGACRAPIFNSNTHKELFLTLLAEMVRTFKIEIHAYCLMDNHYHLLIRTPLANISKAMRYLNSVYTIKYNKLEKKDGALFRGRFKSMLVESDGYGIHLVRYIHLNPYEAKMVAKIEDYEWSSFRAYLGLVNKPSWLSFSYTLKHFNGKNFFNEFIHFTYAGNPDFIVEQFSGAGSHPIIGSDAFINSVKSDFQYSSVSDEISERKILRPTLDQIVNEVSIAFESSISEVKKSRRGITNDARTMTMLIASKYFGYKLPVISEYFGLSSYQTVSKLYLSLQKKMYSDSRLKWLLSEILKNCKL